MSISNTGIGIATTVNVFLKVLLYLLSDAYFGLFFLCRIDNGSAAHFCNLAAFTIERPTADLISKHVFDKQDAAIKSKHEFVKQLNVLQQVIIRVAGRETRQRTRNYNCADPS